jgi:hypothetical protein
MIVFSRPLPREARDVPIGIFLATRRSPGTTFHLDRKAPRTFDKLARFATTPRARFSHPARAEPRHRNREYRESRDGIRRAK